MKTENLIKFKSWRVEYDICESEFKQLDENILAYELKKPNLLKNNIHIYNNVKLYLNHYFKNNKYFYIPKCKQFKITYKTKGNCRLYMTIEENYNYYNFYYIFPESKEWKTKVIKINDFIYDGKEKIKLNLNKITGFIFSLYSNNKTDAVLGSFYIKEFIIKGYEIITIKDKISRSYLHYFLEKKVFNIFKVFFSNIKQKIKIADDNGNPLYCIYPFYQYRMNFEYNTVCCDLYIDEKVNFIKNKNLINIWRGNKFDEIREDIKNLTYSKCNLKTCDQYNTSKRSFMNLKEIKNKYPDIADYLTGKTEKYRGNPGYIVIGFDKDCNLNCKSCSVSEKHSLSKNIKETYFQEIEKIGNNVEKITIAGFGDPFGTSSYRNWLFNFPISKFPKLHTIEIMTNALLWTEKNWNRIPDEIKRKHILGTISIDGATKKTYEYNRYNAKFEKLIENLLFISKLKKINEINVLSLCFVVQQNNYQEIPLMIKFAKKYAFDAICFNPITNWGSYSEKEFNNVNIFNKEHPEYNNFRKILEEVRKSKIDDMIVEFRFKL